VSKVEKQEVAKQSTPTQLDGFTGYDDRIEGDGRPQGGSVIQGVLIKFTNEGTWVTGDGEEMPAGIELIAAEVIRIAQKWVDQKPEETIFVAPGEKFPDVEEMNAKAPKSEWHEDLNGRLVGPWQNQQVLYLVDPKTLDRYSYPTSTVGGAIAIRELCDKVKWMRRHRPSANAVVTLSDVHMRTRFGGRQRPHFNICHWTGLEDESALPPPTGKPPGGAAAIMHEIKEPSLREELADDLPDSCK
jgi:hypothetical protein